MAHRIEFKDEQWGIEMAWHKLTKIKPVLSLRENPLTKYDLIRVPGYVRNPVTNEEIENGSFSLCASDDGEVLSNVSDTYGVLSNSDLLEIAESSLTGAGHTLVSIGTVRGRRTIFLSYKIEGMDRFTGAGREIRPYFNILSSHDERIKANFKLSTICPVCDNTVGWSLAEKGSDLDLMIKHTKNAKAKLPAVGKAIEKAIGTVAEFQKAMDDMANESVSQDEAQAFMLGFLSRSDKSGKVSTRKANTVAELVGLFASGRGNKGQDRSDLFQGLTEFYTHRSAGGDDVGKQYMSSEFGDGADAKEEAFAVIRDGAKYASTLALGRSLMPALAAN